LAALDVDNVQDEIPNVLICEQSLRVAAEGLYNYALQVCPLGKQRGLCIKMQQP
jgi:hypothetical protein